MTHVVEDRVLARIALDAVSWGGADPAVLADVALGQAVVALRVLGINATPQVTRAVSEDIADIIADPARLALARGSSVGQGRPAARAGRLAA